ncbi:hypothetical protein BJ165DRAFT_1409389 [Panaeolus papilionaceus]|nr:hypothetical protein BJ165DRAFT_1409389 [Panaeolus papilionaceus]
MSIFVRVIHRILTFSSVIGPTGAGKSTLIEALAGESQNLSISKDQLAGYTQTINAYRLVNVTQTQHHPPRPVYLIDTPGFSDSKFSEIEIIDMIRTWLEENGIHKVGRILFLTPITGTRLSGSRRRTIEMLKQFLEPNDGIASVVFVTTMWNTLHNEETRSRAEATFAQLNDDVCKDFYGLSKISITRFMNTRKTALRAMDSASSHLYRDLHHRIEGALREKQVIESDLSQPDTQTNNNLKAVLESNQEENNKTLTKFIGQWHNFGPPPKGFEDAHACLRASINSVQQASPPRILLRYRGAGAPPNPPVSFVAPGNHYPTTQGPNVLFYNHSAPVPGTYPAVHQHYPSTHPSPRRRLSHRRPISMSSVSTSVSPSVPPAVSTPVPLPPSRKVRLKEIHRELVQAAKRLGKKWLKKLKG